ncbi:MAG TPA: DNA translocase FtsK 4TM domain-containing protein [Steroidobacteraceae bacterium]|nr:DNA translocase FtsK 4TM domain-containing protein [Steroidobacteraceae bacterium]
MTEAAAQKSSKQHMKLSAAVSRSLREGTLWILCALALLLLLALLSYQPHDPGFADTGEPGPVSNWIGPVGAWLAGFFLFLFGRPAYLFPLMLAYAGWLVHMDHSLPDARSGLNTLLRAVGFVLTLLTSCGLTTLHWDGSALPNSAGGVLGELVGNWAARGLSFLGATLLLLGLWLAGVALFLGVSWFDVMDKLGAWVLQGIDWARAKIDQRRELAFGQQRKQARQEVVREEQRKVANRPPPRIEAAAAVPQKSERVERERQVPLFDAPKSSELPALSLLDEPRPREQSYSDEALEAMSRLVELKLRDFGVEAEVVAVQPGPVITRFELRPAPGVKVNQISNLAKDLARALSAISVRVVEIIPGKSVVGLEIPNEKREIVTLGEIIKSKPYDEVTSPLALALGKDIGGVPVVADLARMPHLLIAGTTGSGKSVAINAMVLSLIYKATPEHVRMIMIDPKMLELSVYEGIPHLLSPVVTDMKQAANALRWCVAEMERRYQLMSALGVRNIGGFNRKVKEAADAGKPIKDPIRMQKVMQAVPGVVAEDVPALSTLPFIVVIIDELADLMMIVGKRVEELIARLAQKARASGIHLILATQRPSVDVITGLIKANIPTRIAFQVSAKVDSRTILDQSGAESLLGHGDMLYLPPGTSIPTRVHGAFVSDQEVHRVVAGLKTASPPIYIEEILEGPRTPIPGFPTDDEESAESDLIDAEADPLYDEAVRIVTETRKASISGVQRRLKIGYNRAARLVEAMEAAGLVGPLQSNGAREIYGAAPPEE